MRKDRLDAALEDATKLSARIDALAVRLDSKKMPVYLINEGSRIRVGDKEGVVLGKKYKYDVKKGIYFVSFRLTGNATTKPLPESEQVEYFER